MVLMQKQMDLFPKDALEDKILLDLLYHITKHVHKPSETNWNAMFSSHWVSCEEVKTSFVLFIFLKAFLSIWLEASPMSRLFRKDYKKAAQRWADVGTLEVPFPKNFCNNKTHKIFILHNLLWSTSLDILPKFFN